MNIDNNKLKRVVTSLFKDGHLTVLVLKRIKQHPKEITPPLKNEEFLKSWTETKILETQNEKHPPFVE